MRQDVSSPPFPTFYPEMPTSQLPLQVYCFGDFRLYREGQLIDDPQWKRKRARSLCAYLIYHQGHFIPRDQLIELFWPEQSVEAAQRNCAAQFHLLRRILEPGLQRGQKSRYLVREHDGYRFDPEGMLWSDVKQFELIYEQAIQHHCASETCKAARAFMQLGRLYLGDFLNNERYETWCIAPRRRFLNMYIDSLIHLSDYAFKQGDYRQSLHWLNRGLREDKCHEELHQRRILTYQQLTLYNEALRCYHDYCEVMEEELDSYPSPQMRVIYEQLRTACPSANQRKPQASSMTRNNI